MTLDEILVSLFPGGHDVQPGRFNTWHGVGHRDADNDIALIGIAGGTPLGVESALELAGHVLSAVEKGDSVPMVMLVDSGIQNLTRRDELLGLSEYLGHLTKVLALAALRGHRTITLLYGPAAGGSLIATALSTQILVALPGAEPSVMDLPSIARVTKLPLDQLKAMAKSTPIFAPGIEPLFLTGAIAEKWDEKSPLSPQLALALRRGVDALDRRDEIGLARRGRLQASGIAQRVATEASHV
jgi:malonate decarboxylase gamma subunit